MTEMTINVNVSGCAKFEIGVSPQLEQLLTRLLAPREYVAPTRDAIAKAQMAPEIEESRRLNNWPEPSEPQTDEPKPEPEPTPTQAPATVEPLTLEHVTPPEDALPFDQEQPQTETQAPALAPFTYDDRAMRKIMADTRLRLLGEGFTKDHPLYKRLNGQFKTEASIATGGKCDTPTKLPELGESFCIIFQTACESLAIDPVTNDIIQKPPF